MERLTGFRPSLWSCNSSLRKEDNSEICNVDLKMRIEQGTLNVMGFVKEFELVHEIGSGVWTLNNGDGVAVCVARKPKAICTKVILEELDKNSVVQKRLRIQTKKMGFQSMCVYEVSTEKTDVEALNDVEDAEVEKSELLPSSAFFPEKSLYFSGTCQELDMGDDQPEISTESKTFDEAEAFVKEVLGDADKLAEQWDTIDDNRSSKVSLAEIGGYVKKVFGDDLHNAPALMRAYKKTCLRDGDGDDWVEKNEFPSLLRNILYFNRAYVVFDDIDTGDDRRIDIDEFKAGLSQLGMELDDEEAEAEFASMDENDGGQILFDEFCAFLAEKSCPVDGEVMESFTTSGE